MKSTPINRYFWLLNLLYSTGGISRTEIDKCWEKSNLNVRRDKSIPDSTFFHWIEIISRQWGVDIIYDRKSDKYLIDNCNGENRFFEWMMRSIAVTDVVRESGELRKRILLEPIPSGERWLRVFIYAMKDNREVEMTYQRFDAKEPDEMTFRAYTLKNFKQRWYVMGESSNHEGETRVYALDRIRDVRMTDREFKMPKDFDSENALRDVYGVWIGTELPVELVRVMVTESEANYLRTLPLHPSQREIGPATRKGWIEFEWKIKPTYDFIMELRSHGKRLKVLESDTVKREINR